MAVHKTRELQASCPLHSHTPQWGQEYEGTLSTVQSTECLPIINENSTFAVGNAPSA